MEFVPVEFVPVEFVPVEFVPVEFVPVEFVPVEFLVITPELLALDEIAKYAKAEATSIAITAPTMSFVRR